ncbi:twin-arginine translocation signal domain-containing protein [candidate division KSB1 bacterium]|nr:twin-arginine translocation signal domain-containing protein [candidate division KSB1 bacterium]
MASGKMTRRDFLGGAATAAAGFMIVPRHVLGGPGYMPPSDKLNIVAVGAGGKGKSDIEGVSAENVVALCDVDDEKMAEFKERADEKEALLKIWEKANKYRDFRVMFEKEDFDAVTISTPDHTHAVIAMMAMKMGKHVFCQKPLTHSVYEARLLAETAKKQDVVTQMGNQGHASEVGRLINEWIWDGAIGDVREVHCWTNRPIWPQGINRPEEVPYARPSLDWDLWVGPAPWRPYHPDYVPFSWRGWWDFGTGAIGDMGAHIIDHPYWALNLGHPTTVHASSTEFTEDSFPKASVIHYTFPARGKMPPVMLAWYDGGLTPPRPEELEPGRRMGDGGGGVIFIGDKGKLMCSTYGRNPRLIPETFMKQYDRPEKTIPRSPGIHEEWIEAIKADKKSTTDFSYSGPLTEMMLLGNIAIRCKDKNTVLEWDADKMEVTNLPEANEFLQREYREGWSL